MRCGRALLSATSVSPDVTGVLSSSAAPSQWTPQQRCYRELMKGLRAAYFHDRAKLFWARHRVLIEFYKYAEEGDPAVVQQVLCLALEVASFIQQHMRMNVERIAKHNEVIMTLPVDRAKKYRNDFLLAEKQHDSWCKQKIKAILKRRPPPPYPFF